MPFNKQNSLSDKAHPQVALDIAFFIIKLSLSLARSLSLPLSLSLSPSLSLSSTLSFSLFGARALSLSRSLALSLSRSLSKIADNQPSEIALAYASYKNTYKDTYTELVHGRQSAISACLGLSFFVLGVHVFLVELAQLHDVPCALFLVSNAHVIIRVFTNVRDHV